MAYLAFNFISDQKLKFADYTIFCLPLLMDWFLLSWVLVETIISYKKLSHLFLFPGIIYGKIQQLVELSARNGPLKENIRERKFSSVYFKVEVKEEGELGEWLHSHCNLWRLFTNSWRKLQLPLNFSLKIWSSFGYGLSNSIWLQIIGRWYLILAILSK